MVKTRTRQFQQFLNKFIKVRYKDGTVLSIARGILVKEDDTFLFLKGNYTQTCIHKESILKISSPEPGDSNAKN